MYAVLYILTLAYRNTSILYYQYKYSIALSKTFLNHKYNIYLHIFVVALYSILI